MGSFKISALVGAEPKAKDFRQDVRTIQRALKRFSSVTELVRRKKLEVDTKLNLCNACVLNILVEFLVVCACAWIPEMVKLSRPEGASRTQAAW